MKTMQEDGWSVETFDNHEIARKENDGKFWIIIRSHQARTRGRYAGICYSFKDELSRENYFKNWKAERETKIAARNLRLEEKRQARATFVNPYKAGDILHSSWGYDQTNVEFFEVLEARPRALKLVQIGADLRETGFMSGETTPCPGKHIGEPSWVTIQISVYGGKMSHHIPSPIHGGLYPVGARKSVHCSWYA